MTLREIILAADDRKKEVVEVPEWGCSVTLRSLSAKDRIALAKEPMKDPGARVLVASVYDDQGKPVFTDSDIASLMEKDGEVLDRLSAKVVKLSGFGSDEQATIEKN